MAQPDSSADRTGFAAEAGHFFLCRQCGQYVDRRNPDQMRHHQRLSHRALPPN